MPAAPPSRRFSLRHLLGLVAYCALALTALKFAGPVWWTVLTSVAMLVFAAALVFVFIERGPQQAAAIGFVLSCALYGLLLFFVELTQSDASDQFDPFSYSPALPTTMAMRPVFQAVSGGYWTDAATGQRIPDFDPANPGPYNVQGSGVFKPGAGFASFHERPPRLDFMRIAHLLWALLFGYVGALFAGFVYARRIRRESATTEIPKERLA